AFRWVLAGEEVRFPWPRPRSTVKVWPRSSSPVIVPSPRAPCRSPVPEQRIQPQADLANRRRPAVGFVEVEPLPALSGVEAVGAVFAAKGFPDPAGFAGWAPLSLAAFARFTGFAAGSDAGLAAFAPGPASVLKSCGLAVGDLDVLTVVVDA